MGSLEDVLSLQMVFFFLHFHDESGGREDVRWPISKFFNLFQVSNGYYPPSLIPSTREGFTSSFQHFSTMKASSLDQITSLGSEAYLWTCVQNHPNIWLGGVLFQCFLFFTPKMGK